MTERKTIGVFVGNTHSDHPQKMIEGLYDFYRASACDVHFFLGNESSMIFRSGTQFAGNFDYQYLSAYDYRKFDDLSSAILLIGTIFTKQDPERKQAFVDSFASLPTLVMGDTIHPARGATICSDNYGGMYAIVNHLIEDHSLKRIVYLSGPAGISDSDEREKAYRDCMAAHGLPVTKSMVAYGDFSEYVDDTVEELVDRNPGLEAIVSANDSMTVPVYKILEQRGRRPGKDVAVTGFDNIETATMAKPPLTTVRQRSLQIGQIGAEEAIALAEGKPVSDRVISVDFIRRHSCGCREAVQAGSNSGNRTYKESAGFLRQLLHKALLGPFLLRDLDQASDDRNIFFYKVGTCLRDLGVSSSYIYLLPEFVDNAGDGTFRLPGKLIPAMKQVGDTIYSYDQNHAPEISKGQGLCRYESGEGKGRVYFNFLLFNGARQYGILSIETGPEELQFYYMLAMQIGTAIRFMEMKEKEQEYRERLREQNEILKYNATNDALAGIRNRRGIMSDIPDYAKEHRGELAYLLIGDLDHLKQINDRFGHIEGDFAIRKAADLLKEILGPEAIIGRIGGDEYLAVFPPLAGEAGLNTASAGRKPVPADEEIDSAGNNGRDEALRRIRQATDEYNRTSDKPYYVELSIGMIPFRCTEAPDIQGLIRNADSHLYEAKRNRRTNVAKNSRKD